MRLNDLFSKTTEPQDEFPPWLKGDTMTDLYPGVHYNVIADTFFGARGLKPRGQLNECVKNALTTLVTSEADHHNHENLSFNRAKITSQIPTLLPNLGLV